MESTGAPRVPAHGPYTEPVRYTYGMLQPRDQRTRGNQQNVCMHVTTTSHNKQVVPGRSTWGDVRAYDTWEVRMKSSVFDVHGRMHTGVQWVIWVLWNRYNPYVYPTGSVRCTCGHLRMPYRFVNTHNCSCGTRKDF